MKILKSLLALALIVPGLALAQSTNGVVRNGYNTSVVAPDAVGTSVPTGVSIIVPRTDGTYKVILGGATTLYQADGGGSSFLPRVNPAAVATPVAIANSGTIDTTITRQRVSTAGAVTGVILEDGTADGQMVYVQVDKDAAGSITFAAEATSNVCSGTAAVIAAGEGALFLYDSTDTCWTELGT